MQYGQEDEYEFYNYELPPPKPSGWIDYPTPENPDGFYKFASIEINMSQDLISWHRQTYSSLDWIGDLGGLFDGLRYFFLLVITPFTSYGLQSKVLSTFFRVSPSEPPEQFRRGQ